MGNSRTQSFVFLWILILCCGNVLGQSDTTKHSVYRVNYKLEIPLTLGMFGASYFGFNYLSEKEGVSYNDATTLSPDDVWWFDRPATKQDASKRLDAHKTSDVLLNTSVLLSAILTLDKNIRRDWLDLLVLYGESHVVGTNLYILNSAFISRARPFNYNAEVPISEKMANESRNSWYSGHVSSAATASFFMAKVYSDYHPQLGNKKYWLFSAALIPPALVGLYRYKAMKHFPSDIMFGTLAGAATGILIPHIHKRKNKESALSVVPFAGKINGIQLSYTFK